MSEETKKVVKRGKLIDLSKRKLHKDKVRRILEPETKIEIYPVSKILEEMVEKRIAERKEKRFLKSAEMTKISKKHECQRGPMETELLFDSKAFKNEDVLFDTADYMDSFDVEDEIRKDVHDIMASFNTNGVEKRIFLLVTPLEHISIAEIFNMIREEAQNNYIKKLRVCVASKQIAIHLKNRFPLKSCQRAQSEE